MATLVNNGDINLSGNWNVCSNIDTFYQAGVAINTTAKYSATWTANNSNTDLGCLIQVYNNGTAETITVQLQGYSGGSYVDISGVSATYNIDYSTPKYVSEQYPFSGESIGKSVIFLKFANSHTEDSNTYSSYRLKFTGSASGTSTSLCYASGQSSQPAKMMVTSATDVLTNNLTGNIIICGYSTSGTVNNSTVTMDINDSTNTYIKSSTAFMSIGVGGILNWANAANTQLKIGGVIYVCGGGTFQQGTTSNPIGSAYTSILQFSGYGRILVCDRGSVSIQGYSKFGATPTNFRTNLASQTNSGVSDIVCNLDVQAAGWANGDIVTVQATNGAGQSEYGTITALSGTTFRISTGNLYTHKAGAEVCNLTRNIEWDGNCSTAQKGCLVFMNSASGTIDIDYMMMNTYVGTGSSTYSVKAQIFYKSGSSTFNNTFDKINIDNCSFRNLVLDSTYQECLYIGNINASNLVAYGFGTRLVSFVETQNISFLSIFNNCSVINFSPSSNTTSVFCAPSASGQRLILNNCNIYDRANNPTVAYGIMNEECDTTINNCKIFGMKGSGSNGCAVRGFNSDIFRFQANNCIFGNDGTNDIDNYADIDLRRFSGIYLTNCKCSSTNIIGNTGGISDSIYGGVTDNAYGFVSSQNHGLNGSNVQYQLSGTLSNLTYAGLSSAYARGGSGDCVVIKPTNTTYPVYFTYFIPVTGGTPFHHRMYITKNSANWNGTVKISIYDTNNYTKLLNQSVVTNASIPVNNGSGSPWTYQWDSGSLTPTNSGNNTVKVVVEVIKGSDSSFVMFDDITTS